MTLRRALLVLLPLALLAGWLAFDRGAPAGSVVVERGELAVWSTYAGTLESRVPALVTSRLRSSAAIVELVADGTRVKRGDVLARLDVAALERELIRLERDHATAEAALATLQQANGPLELRDLARQAQEARTALEGEQRYLQALQDSLAGGIASAEDLERQKTRVAVLADELETAELRLRLTEQKIQPAAITDARARRDAAARELQIAREQMQHGIIRAPVDGVVVFRPMPLGTEVRTVRIGDSIYPNQPFMSITDMKDLVAQASVPEAEFARAPVGTQAFVNPVSLPGLRLRGRLESLSPMAQGAAGRPAWEKYFGMTIALDEWHENLRPGMSVTVQVLSHYNAQAMKLPRTAVRWRDGKPWATVLDDGEPVERALQTGMASEREIEVLDGLREGETVLAP
jgi:multidrug efflux pump subunit AcrA (membrane-fusion protein)